MTIKMHVFPLSPRAFKVLLAAHQIGVPYDMTLLNLAVGDQRKPDYAKINPNQRMPSLEDGDFRLWESNAIVNYLAEQKPDAGYLPRDVKTRALTQQWQFWEANHWDPACAIFMFENFVKKLFGRGDADPNEIKRGTELMSRLAPVFDGQLQKTRYIVGDRMTVADLCLAADLVSAGQAQMPLSEYRNIQRWIAEMRALPAWQKTAAMQKPPG